MITISVFSSLRSRNFALYFTGQCISLCGSWIQQVAMSWLVYRITGSIILLTSLIFVHQIPNLIMPLFSGVISDRYDKRRIVIITQLLLMTQSLILALLVLSGKAEVWHLFVLASFSGCAAAFEAPVRQSFYTKLVPAENMANAIALNSATINISRFIGPTIGGILIAWVGEGWCFLINCVSFLAMLTALSMMRLQSFAYDSDQIGVLRSFREGVDYIRQTLPLKTLLIFMAALCFLGMPFLTITSALVKDILGGNSVQLGYVTSSFGAGALAAAFFLATRRSIAGLGKMLSLTGTMLGVALIVISFIHQTWAACLVSFLIGLTLIGSVSTTNTLVQTIVADNKRGRLMSFFTMAYAGMPPLGGLAYGFFAKTTSLSLSLLCAGAMCVIAAAIYEWRRPAVRAATDEYMLKQNSVSENNTVNTDIF